MFKYISEILSKFSQQQSILALVILVVSIFLITYGGKIIDGFTETDNRLTSEVNSLRKANRELSLQNDTLQRIIFDNQLQCGEDIAEVRRRILEDLGILERQLQSQMMFKQRLSAPHGSLGSDTVMMMSPTPVNDNTSTTMMLEGIRKLKEKIKN